MAYKPYRVKNKNDIYAKYENKRNVGDRVDDGRMKLFGFRSGLAYKMFPAIFYYAFALFYIGTGIYGEIRYLEFEPMDVLLTAFKYIFWIVIFFSPAIFLSDFKYRDSLPFFKKRQVGSSLIGLLIVWMFCYFMANVNIYCMSQTYRESLARHNESLVQEQQESQQKQESETTTLDESVTKYEESTVS